jgi:hypothetical protein
MDHIIDYIKRYFNYRENECIMCYFINDDSDFIEFNDISLKLKKEKKIIGTKVIPFNYKNRSGDIMTYNDKYIIITLYPNVI